VLKETGSRQPAENTATQTIDVEKEESRAEAESLRHKEVEGRGK